VNDHDDFFVILFDSVHHALMAEKILKKEGIPIKLIPVPKHISSDCGICIRYRSEHDQSIKKQMTEILYYKEIRPLHT
jgi:hypothetical protein